MSVSTGSIPYTPESACDYQQEVILTSAGSEGSEAYRIDPVQAKDTKLAADLPGYFSTYLQSLGIYLGHSSALHTKSPTFNPQHL